MRLIINIEGSNPRVVDIDEEAFTIGRSLKNSVSIESDSVSRSHLKLRSFDGSILIMDLGSANGTFINGERLEPNKEIPWHTFLPISLGEKVSLSFGTINQESAPSEKPKSRPVEKISSRQDRGERNRSKPNKVEKRRTGVNPLLIYGTITLTLAYFFYNYYEGKKYQETAITQAKKETKKSKLLINAVSPLQDQLKCQEEEVNQFCNTLKTVTDHGEGVILKDADAIIYVNFNQRLQNAEIDPSFSSANEKDRMAYLMTFLAFREDIRLLMKKQGLKNLLIVDVSSNPSKVNQVIKVTQLNLQKLTTIDIKTVFAGVINKNPTLFEALIAPVIEIEYAK